MEKGNGDSHSHHQGGVPLDWRYGNQMDSFCPAPCWDQSANAHNLNFYESNAPRPDINWNPILMEMASMAGHFGLNQPCLDPYSNPPRPVSQPPTSGGSIGGGPSDAMAAVGGNGMQDSGNLQCLGISGNESSEAKPGSGGQEELSSKELSAKKRKRSAKEIGTDQSKEEGSDAGNNGDESKLKLEQGSSALANAKFNGKHGKAKIDPPKDDYIHVRACRGQVTNIHSIAERVRREKISERMKLLQDLVPGCNKVTGKAVMLDEIINYVQSLQRQVEFLSMKLAAINPQINFNIEGLLSKDILQSHAGPLSTAGFTTSLVHPLLHQNIQDLVQSGTFGMAAPPDVLRRAVNAQMTAMAGLKDSKQQMSDVWERAPQWNADELHWQSTSQHSGSEHQKSRQFSDVMKLR